MLLVQMLFVAIPVLALLGVGYWFWRMPAQDDAPTLVVKNDQ
jgi:Tfp pilus assembly protein PilO